MLIVPHERRVRAEQGFTLVELLVAMAAGIVIVFGLSAILIATLHQTQRSFTRVDATRQARTALGTIENELHSACVGNNAAPIQPGSDDNTLIFLSYFGAAVSPTPAWHRLRFSGSTLTDTTYAVTGSAGSWSPTGSGTTTTLLSNVAVQPGGPVFRYYAYKSEFTDASGNVYWTIPDGTNPLPTTGAIPSPAPLSTSPSGLSDADAASAVEVVINLLVGASSENLNKPSLAGASDPVTDAISLRLTTPPDYSSAGSSGGYGPCQ